MKKIILSISIVMACLTANAQEPEKKKESSTPAPSRGQERAINDIGVSSKSETKKSSSTSKQAPPPAAPASPPKPADKPKEPKKPE